GHAERGDLLVVAHSPVGDDPGGAVVARADREDVPQGAGFDDAAGLDHEDLAFLHRVERALLRVVAAAVGCEQVLSVGDEAQRLRGAQDLAGTRLRLDAVDVDVVQSALRSICESVATGHCSSFARSSADRPVVGGSMPAASADPRASIRCVSSTEGNEPIDSSKPPLGPSTIVVTNRPEVCPVAGASTSTSTTSPGCTTEDPAGVPVRMMSPVSKVKCW